MSKKLYYLLLCIVYMAQLVASGTDFDVSMGSNDPYLGPLYKKLLKNLHKPDSRWFRFISNRINPAHDFAHIKANYQKNQNASDQKNGREIPRIFHQIWVGKNPFPEKYKRWQKTWQSIPGWQYKLWTDKDVEQFPLINRKAYENEKNYGARADILRLEILYNYGGVYIDTDFECIKPEMFDALNSSYDFYCCLEPLDHSALLINNAIIGSIPKHPILKACIDELPKQGAAKKNWQIVFRGPGLITAMVLKHMDKGYRDMVFPPTFFYPLGVLQLQRKPYSSMPFCEATLEKIKKDVIKPETIAIHWWDGSWSLPSAQVR